MCGVQNATVAESSVNAKVHRLRWAQNAQCRDRAISAMSARLSDGVGPGDALEDLKQVIGAERATIGHHPDGIRGVAGRAASGSRMIVFERDGFGRGLIGHRRLRRVFGKEVAAYWQRAAARAGVVGQLASGHGKAPPELSGGA